ncbi:hypothetical protein GQX74_009428 [Glossina fuscipes]|nr:hypothetical protein GQX74_009428 [Glossina fuscipes]
MQEPLYTTLEIDIIKQDMKDVALEWNNTSQIHDMHNINSTKKGIYNAFYVKKCGQWSARATCVYLLTKII